MRSGRGFVYLTAVLSAFVGISAGDAGAQNWNGSGTTRFGVFLQGSVVNYDLTRREADGSLFRQTASPSALGVGIAAGYDLRMGNFIVGAEADVSFDGGGAKAKPESGTQYGVDYLATLRGRLGYAMTPGLVLYGTAGYGLQGAEYKANAIEGGGAPGTANKKNGTLGGITYGAGFEYDLGWGTGFVEYLHHDLGGWSFRSFAGNMRTVDGSQDVVRIGLKFTTGHDHGSDVYRRR